MKYPVPDLPEDFDPASAAVLTPQPGDRAIDILERIREIRIARLRPGDVVLVRTPAGMVDVDLEGMLATVQHWFPHNDVRICAGIDIEVVRPEALVRYEKGSLDWGDSDPCAHQGDPCVKCGKPFPLEGVPVTDDRVKSEIAQRDAIRYERVRMAHQHPGEHDWPEWSERSFSDESTYHWRICPCGGIDGYWTRP
jgi:hypothetical protein